MSINIRFCAALVTHYTTAQCSALPISRKFNTDTDQAQYSFY